MRYLMEVSYRGTHFHGWQSQPNAVGVQEILEKALGVVLRQAVTIVGSSRTDTGVHARQQFAHFDWSSEIPAPDRLVHGLNSVLPKDVAVNNIIRIKDEVHARFAATYRCYEYRIVTQKNPFLTDLAWLFRPDLDVTRMNEAARLLLRYEDFECFSKTHTDVKTFLCQIEYAFWQETSYGLVFQIKANRFLRGMVRAVVGTLVEVGQGKMSVADFDQIIQSKSRKNAAAQAPACGLFLTEVGYDWGKIVYR